MLFGLGLWDYVWLAAIVAAFSGGAATTSYLRPSDAARLRRLENKLDLILEHLRLEFRDPATLEGLSSQVQSLADDPTKKFAAIKQLREETGLGLKEAKEVIEAYTRWRHFCQEFIQMTGICD